MKKILMVSALALASVCGGVQPSYADILITPTRILFEERDKFAVVNLVNNGDEPTTYEIGWAFFEMQEEGAAYKPVEEPPGGVDITQYIKYSPRRVTLKPGAKQKIRLKLARPSDLPEGDYHAHLRFRQVEGGDDADFDVANTPENSTGASVKINVGYTIPVFLHVGEGVAQAEIGQMTLSRNEVNGMLQASVPVKRLGEGRIVMGHLKVYHIAPDGREEIVGEISNAHIFPEIDQRIYNVKFVKNVSGGQLRVVMDDYVDNTNFIYAEKVFPLQ